MPWKNKGIMSLREEFIAKAQEKTTTTSHLCREYGISRKTAYKWLKRYSEEGILGLQDRDRRPSCMPLRIRDQFFDLVIGLRNKSPAWGAKKLRQVLLNEGYKNIPSVSTFNRL